MPLPNPDPGHMSAEAFRQRGREVIDLIADYMQRVESLRVLPDVRPGDIAALLPLDAPEQPEAWDGILADIQRIVMPGLTHWQSPNFFAFFPANSSGPAILGDLLASGLGVQGMLWQTSPACTEIETRVLDWLGRAIGLPESFLSGGEGGGVIQGTASEATLVAMLAGRERVRGGPALRAGHRSSNGFSGLTVYTSTQAHSSVIKAAMISGIAASASDREHIRLIPTDAAFRMDSGALEDALREDVSAGRVPCCVVATLGTTGCGASDSIGEVGAAIARACPDVPPWLHVDAAWAGAALVCPEHQHLIGAIGQADSFCFNPHKWLLTNFDCDAMWVRDRRSLIGALSIAPEYLRNAASDSGAVIDYRDWQVPLGRRFRALKLWFVLRHYGLAGLRAHIREHVRLGELFESLVRADARFEIAAPRALSLVCFRLVQDNTGAPIADPDAANRSLLERINASGRAYLIHTVLPAAAGAPPRAVLRMAIGGTHTTETHVRNAWGLIQSCADDRPG